MIELTFLKVLILIRQVNQNSVLFAIIGIFIFIIHQYWYVDYHCIFNGMSKSEAVNLLQNADFNEKSGTL